MRTLLLVSVFLIINAFSCEEEVVCPVDPPQACQDKVPTDEMCDAYFIRWFYNPEAKSCQRAEYSGCNEKGFATQQECEACVGG